MISAGAIHRVPTPGVREGGRLRFRRPERRFTRRGYTLHTKGWEQGAFDREGVIRMSLIPLLPKVNGSLAGNSSLTPPGFRAGGAFTQDSPPTVAKDRENAVTDDKEHWR